MPINPSKSTHRCKLCVLERSWLLFSKSLSSWPQTSFHPLLVKTVQNSQKHDPSDQDHQVTYAFTISVVFRVISWNVRVLNWFNIPTKEDFTLNLDQWVNKTIVFHDSVDFNVQTGNDSGQEKFQLWELFFHRLILWYQ